MQVMQMPDNTRFFLGFGERLTSRIAPPVRRGGSEPAYSFEEAVARLTPLVELTATGLGALPRSACPGGEAVGVVTLHPQWMAKSYHPQQLLDAYDLRQVGSRPVAIRPEKWTRQEETAEAASSELYVAGHRDSFARWAQDLAQNPARVPTQIRQLESVRAPEPAERIRNVHREASANSELFEVVLHASEAQRDQFILSGFSEYAQTLGIEPDFDRRLYAGGLCFLPVEAAPESVDELVQFAFLRVARPMPKLRSFPTLERSVPSPGLQTAPLPTEDAVDPDLRIAVFDGGLDAATPLGRWATGHDAPGVGPETPEYLRHGHDVTSALLFGSLTPGEPAPRPYGVVDHYRVLDKDAGTDPYELYEVLRRIDAVLRTNRHQFINLSIGPELPVEDDQVHTWTAVLDEHLSDGNTLAALAVGNTGHLGLTSGEARIQVPADCVNGLSVGAADSRRSDWERAPYSSWGPGRSPGVVKPDVVHFGGDGGQEQFLVYDAAAAPALAQTAGTSFATPAALRLAVGVRAHFGGRIGPLALKALLVHSAQDGGHPREEVGWGRLPREIADVAECPDGMVRVVYQGELSPSQYLRAPIPLPDEPLLGMVTVEATFCYATPTDPEDPGSYTRSGLEVTFRPHMDRYKDSDSTLPKSASFFKKSDFETEQAMRSDAQKWETTLNARGRFRSASLAAPVFDVHYNARSSGGAAREAERIRYALVVTIRAPRAPDLYDRVVRAFAGRLEALTPIVEIPVRV
jgi:Subtilase family